MPVGLDKRLQALEQGKAGKQKGKRLLVWREGDPEPRLKKGQPCVRVYRSHMDGSGMLLTPLQIAALKQRMAEIVVEREERAAAVAKQREASVLEAQAAAAARAKAAATSPTAAARHTVDDAQPVQQVAYTAEQLAALGWSFDPVQGLVLGAVRRA